MARDSADARVRRTPAQWYCLLAGYRVLRFTWEHVTARPAYVAGTLRRALGAP